MRKKRLMPAIALLLLAAGGVQAGGLMEPSNWSAENGGNPILPAEVRAVDTDHGQAIQATVMQNGRYQGLNVILPEPVDLAKVAAITFKIHQTAVCKYPAHGRLYLLYADGGGVMTGFVMANPVDEWCEVTVVPQLTRLKSLRRSVPTAFGMVARLQFTLGAMLDETGQIMQIADLKIRMKTE